MTDTKLFVVRLKFSDGGVEKRMLPTTVLGPSAEQVCRLEAADWASMFNLIPGPLYKDSEGQTVCLVTGLVTGSNGSPVVEVRVV